MSSFVAVRCDQGFILSADSVAFKHPIGEKKFGRVKAFTRKLFQLSDDVLAGAVGDWSSYLPVLNTAARRGLPGDKLGPELLDLCVKKAADSRVFIFYRKAMKVFLDVSELGHIRLGQGGATSYPDSLLNGLFSRVLDSPEGEAVRKTGMLGTAALVGGFNAMATALSPEIAPPFDTVCFLQEGMLALTGGVTRLPVTDFW